MRYETIIVISRYSNELLASNLFPFSEIEMKASYLTQFCSK